MIYPTLTFNYNNSGYAVIGIVDTDVPEEGMLFGMTLEDDERTVSLFMNLLTTFVAQAENFYEQGWYQGFDDGAESFSDEEDDEKNRGTE